MENKINRQTKNEEIDRLLEEQYYAETKILESAILKAAGKSSWEEFPEESEEEIQQGYDRLIARLKEKSEYRESLSENNDHNVSKASRICAETDKEIDGVREAGESKAREIEAEETESVKEAKTVKENLIRLDYEWNKTHRILKPVAAVVAVAMLTALIGMSVTADFLFSDVSVQAYNTSIPEKNKKIYFLCDICHFDSYSICNGSLRKRFLTVSRNETLYTCGS